MGEHQRKYRRRLLAKVGCVGQSDQYNWLQSNGAVQPDVWTELSGVIDLTACDPTEVLIYFEGTGAGIDVYLDDVSATKL